MPTEIQTNGDIEEYVAELAENGLSVYAVSIDNVDQIEEQKELYKCVNENSLILRWTVVLHDETMKMNFMDWLRLAQSDGVRQLSFRKLTAPINPRDKQPAIWISENVHNLDSWMGELEAYIKNRKIIRTLAFGPKVIEAETVSLTY